MHVRTGYLDSEAIRRAMGNGISDVEVADMIAEVDVEGTGRINYIDFIKFWRTFVLSQNVSPLEKFIRVSCTYICTKPCELNAALCLFFLYPCSFLTIFLFSDSFSLFFFLFSFFPVLLFPGISVSHLPIVPCFPHLFHSLISLLFFF